MRSISTLVEGPFVGSSTWPLPSCMLNDFLTFYSMFESIQTCAKIFHALVRASKEASRWPASQ